MILVLYSCPVQNLSIPKLRFPTRRNIMAEFESAVKKPINNERGFFEKLANGDFGLAKTYWVYGVLVGMVVNLLSNFIPSIGGFVIFIIAYTAYEIPVLMGTWKAANKYRGRKFWAVLAKTAVVLGVIMLVAGLLSIISSLG
ncbi:hypothetical protein Noc_0921 [Nitrosococcus oceani ATCC 19707]|uniref:Uncharacterized protein n=2 Tax=Nitrosococcus oceani TaxID=1229 RepID=Q3JCL3_NITOC|nr:hypothetical protein Noc_0921 [Nitrosococcus oceani ATCC 19707]